MTPSSISSNLLESAPQPFLRQLVTILFSFEKADSAQNVKIDLAGGADVLTASGIDFAGSNTILGGAGGTSLFLTTLTLLGPPNLVMVTTPSPCQPALLKERLLVVQVQIKSLPLQFFLACLENCSGQGNDSLNLENDFHLVSAQMLQWRQRQHCSFGLVDADKINILLDDSNNTVDGNDTLTFMQLQLQL